ncbi:MAG: HAD family hydrolase [Actinomycetaceae bacterium]|nr:HAD family hydrolase [Actinomycetaceae bacterium]
MSTPTPRRAYALPESARALAKDIRLVVSDMDETLIGADGVIPGGLWPLIERLRERGAVFAPASGRQYATLDGMFADVAEAMPFICENGAFVVLAGQELHSATVSREVALDTLTRYRRAGREGTLFVISGKRSAYVEPNRQSLIDECARYYAKLEIVEDLATFDDDVVKLAIHDPAGVEQNVFPFIEHLFATHHAASSGPYWVDIAAKHVNKGNAVRRLQETLGVTPEQTVVFGDYLNDVEMMGCAELSFAVANAHPKVREAANYLAPSCSEGGVVTTLQALLAAV